MVTADDILPTQELLDSLLPMVLTWSGASHVDLARREQKALDF